MFDINSLTFALLAAVGWGTYFVPVKKQNNSYEIQAGIGIGAIIFSLISLLFYASLSINIYGIVAGIIWSTANLSMIVAVREIGLARATPLTGSIVIITSFLWGLLYFNEELSSLFYALAGIIALIVAMQMIVVRKKEKSLYGYLFITIAGILWGSVFVPLKFTSFNDSYFSMSLTIFITSIVFIFKSNLKIILYGSISGVIWNISNLAGFIAIESLGLTIGYPLTQSAILISSLWGVLYFKEINDNKQKQRIFIGAIIIIISAILLALAL